MPSKRAARNPASADLDVGALHCGPRDAMRGLFLAHITGTRRVGMIEGFAIDILGAIRKMSPDGIGKIIIRSIGYTDLVYKECLKSLANVLFDANQRRCLIRPS
jgi:hypothetical protein